MIEVDIKESLKSIFGFDAFKGEQEQIINNVLSGKNTFVIMPTGGGKSLCYQLPALILEGTAIVVSPLIALMKNQVDAIRHHSNDESIAHFLNSSLTKREITAVKAIIGTCDMRSKISLRRRYSGRKSCPHSEIQCASSIAKNEIGTCVRNSIFSSFVKDSGATNNSFVLPAWIFSLTAVISRFVSEEFKKWTIDSSLL